MSTSPPLFADSAFGEPRFSCLLTIPALFTSSPSLAWSRPNIFLVVTLEVVSEVILSTKGVAGPRTLFVVARELVFDVGVHVHVVSMKVCLPSEHILFPSAYGWK